MSRRSECMEKNGYGVRSITWFISHDPLIMLLKGLLLFLPEANSTLNRRRFPKEQRPEMSKTTLQC